MTKINENVSIQFVKGENEKDQPEIRLFRNLDGKKGKAVYKFFDPKTITLENFKSIQKMYLILYNHLEYHPLQLFYLYI